MEQDNREAQKLLVLLHPEYVIRKRLRRRKIVTKPQKRLFQLVKERFPNAQMEYPIITAKTVRYADIAIPELKIAIEYDGKRFHKEGSDNERDKELLDVGWLTIHINSSSLQTFELAYGQNYKPRPLEVVST